jgi:hypothetical protein
MTTYMGEADQALYEAERRKTYLGDGVYAEFTRFGDIELVTERDEASSRHIVVLGPREWAALKKFIAEREAAQMGVAT